MTPKAFSYGTLGANNKIYLPPYGSKDILDYMLVVDPDTYEIEKIKIKVNDCVEKWQKGIVYKNKIYWLPYNEDKILVVNTDNNEISYISGLIPGKGKYLQGHIYNNEIIALPYGEYDIYDYILHLDLDSHLVQQVRLNLENNDEKKWHTTQIVDGKIWGMPRGADLDNYFNLTIQYDCTNREYVFIDYSENWQDLNTQDHTNKKFTTMAKVGDRLFCPPYSENPNFDILATFDKTWKFERTGIVTDSRKYFSHTVAKNGKIFFPPAGHEENWSEILVIDTNTDTWYTKELQIGKESKKYFVGIENSQGKIYYIPRGGCVCEPKEEWKQFGDLADVLVVDTKDDTFYTVDISNYFLDNTTIEKYNDCLIYKDKIFAFPYGESESFHDLLVFDTISEKVIKVINLNEL